LNIAFGEDSYYGPSNGFSGDTATGQDMKWNPTSLSYYVGRDTVFHYVLGCKHVIYVFAHTHLDYNNDPKLDMPMYDGCDTLVERLKSKVSTKYRYAWGPCMWVGYPLLKKGEQLLDNEAKVRIRVSKPYEKYGTDDPATNDSLPTYTFNTNGIAPTTNDVATAKTALDIINVVPNPYYAFSGYERNQLDNRIKIVNLPSRCTITIYTPNGTLIRTLKRDVSGNNTAEARYPEINLETSLDWDLKNDNGIPIAGGIYIIHVEADGVGEKTIKWFGALRPIDLDTF